jgi:hypothetical protein
VSEVGKERKEKKRKEKKRKEKMELRNADN